MDVGTRVAYSIRNVARLCVVIHQLDNSVVTVEFDNGKKTNAPLNKLYRVDYWRDRVNEKPLDELKQIPPTMATLEIFKRKRAIVFGAAAMRAMWYWGNVHIFNHKLHEPAFVVGEHMGFYGRYRKPRGHTVGTIWASRARNHSIAELFATVIHEQIHQYNHEVELAAGEFDLREGSHGASFRRWIPIVQQKAGIVITVTGDANKDAAEYEDISEEGKTKPFIFALLHFNHGWLGFVLKDKHELDSFSGAATQALILYKSDDRKVYAGISNLARVKSGLYNAKQGQLNLRRAKHNVSLSVVHLVKNTAQSIPGYLLPDPENT
jgi:hypothetical protein